MKLDVEISQKHMDVLEAIQDAFSNKTLAEAVEFAIEKCVEHEELWLGRFEGAGVDRHFSRGY